MTDIYVELGGKKAIAWSLEWPGWCRIRTSEQESVQALIDTEARYRLIAHRAGLSVAPGDLVIVERLTGDANTAWGVPSVLASAETKPIDATTAQRNVALLRASWDNWKRSWRSLRQNCVKVRVVEVETETRYGATSSKPSGFMRARSECDTNRSR